jgi:SAM-dependent methyltransferase
MLTDVSRSCHIMQSPLLKRVLGSSLYTRYCVLPELHRRFRGMSVTDAFREIYASKMWGSSGESFCSGDGSRGLAAEAYAGLIRDVIRKEGVGVVADLGCGDFQIGSRLLQENPIEYIGVDVVPELVQHLNARFRNERVRFECRDMGCGPLPKADLCLVRQVLQHLSNAQIARVLANVVAQYPVVIISEHVPRVPKKINRDKPQGPDVRAYFGSGVFVDQPPFCYKVERVWDTPLEEDAVLRTALIRNP